MKQRILLVNESSYLATGFSVYGHEVLKRLHATGKYELAELGCYGDVNDPRRWDVPWTFFPNPPGPGEDATTYGANKLNEFGAWKFERTCLDFRPDVVWDIRDWWMCEFQERSPFRPFYHWALMPTVDGDPQDDQWIATYLNADSVHAYTDWGLEVLRRQSNGRIKTYQAAPPGADVDVLQPVPNKESYKQALGLPPGSLVVGTVMRNQARKLYPDLLEAFATFLREAPEHLRNRTYLYLHTCYPDIGWNLPALLKEFGVGHRVLMTYVCQHCGQSYPSWYADALSNCRNCKQNTAVLPHPSKGVGRDVLAKALNVMDVYVQYAVCEGFGMPQVEAASCGVPVLAVDYSAMADVVRKLHGAPIRVQRYFRETGTPRRLALPDNDHLVSELVRLLSLPSPMRLTMGWRARQAVLEHYTYDRTARIWEELFDAIVPRPAAATWESPTRLHRPDLNIPQGFSNEDFVRWCVAHVAGRPELADGYMSLRMVRDLNWGVTNTGMGGLVFNDASAIGVGSDKEVKKYTREDVVRQLVTLCDMQNHWEKERKNHGQA
jgi:glycosyltransferase involved in cell wall biosynthesis